MAADKAVQREREARWSYLQEAYRDPHAARATLDEVVKSQGWTSAATRTAADPQQLGELRAKEGFFARARSRAEREAAQRAVRAGADRGSRGTGGADLPRERGRSACAGRDRDPTPVRCGRGGDRRHGHFPRTKRRGLRHGEPRKGTSVSRVNCGPLGRPLRSGLARRACVPCCGATGRCHSVVCQA
jgi:hypothetical protein